MKIWDFLKVTFSETGQALESLVPAYAGCGIATLVDGPHGSKGKPYVTLLPWKKKMGDWIYKNIVYCLRETTSLKKEAVIRMAESFRNKGEA